MDLGPAAVGAVEARRGDDRRLRRSAEGRLEGVGVWRRVRHPLHHIAPPRRFDFDAIDGTVPGLGVGKIRVLCAYLVEPHLCT